MVIFGTLHLFWAWQSIIKVVLRLETTTTTTGSIRVVSFGTLNLFWVWKSIIKVVLQLETTTTAGSIRVVSFGTLNLFWAWQSIIKVVLQLETRTTTGSIRVVSLGTLNLLWAWQSIIKVVLRLEKKNSDNKHFFPLDFETLQAIKHSSTKISSFSFEKKIITAIFRCNGPPLLHQKGYNDVTHSRALGCSVYESGLLSMQHGSFELSDSQTMQTIQMFECRVHTSHFSEWRHCILSGVIMADH